MKLADVPPDRTDATIGHCLAHRCDRHRGVPLLNTNEESGAECGGCLGETTYDLERGVLWPILDAYGTRMTHGRIVRAKLEEAVRRLELLLPGAGDEFRQWCDDAES